MPKSRSSKDVSQKFKRKQARRIQRQMAFEVATRVRMLAEQMTDQRQLDSMLKQEPDMDRRRKLFEYVSQFVKFANPVCPSPLDIGSTIIKP